MLKTPLGMMFARTPVLILDSAMGTELSRRGIDVRLPLWSARALIASPDAVLQIHRENIAAGADIITTNTFRTTRRSFRRANRRDRSAELTAVAVELAMRARESCRGREVLVAGSIAPLEDCYSPGLVPGDQELADEHGELAGRLAERGVDFLLLETMNCIREAKAACAAAAATGKEVVLSFVCTGAGNLLSGESLHDAVAEAKTYLPAAFSVNCVSPHEITPAVVALASATRLPIAVYANVGKPGANPHGGKFTTDVSAEEYGSHARQWLRAGARIIGGCCGTTPDYTRALAGVVAGKNRLAKTATPESQSPMERPERS